MCHLWLQSDKEPTAEWPLGRTEMLGRRGIASHQMSGGGRLHHATQKCLPGKASGLSASGISPSCREAAADHRSLRVQKEKRWAGGRGAHREP